MAEREGGKKGEFGQLDGVEEVRGCSARGRRQGSPRDFGCRRQVTGCMHWLHRRGEGLAWGQGLSGDE